MKKILLSLFVLSSVLTTFAQQNVGIGTTTPNPRAILDLVSTTQGFLMPRMTTAQRGAMTLGATEAGLVVYDSDLGRVLTWNGSSWDTGSTVNDWALLGNAGTTASNFLGTTDAIALRFRTDNVERMFIDASGNIGVGNTNTFGAKLRVSGNDVWFDNNVNGFFITSASSIGDGYAQQIYNASTGATGSPTMIYAFSPRNNSNNGTTQMTDITMGKISNQNYGYISFSTLNAGNTYNERMRLDAEGRLGIGTTNPLSPLQVGNFLSVIPFDFGGGSLYSMFTYNAYPNTGSMYSINNSSVGFMYMGNDGGGNIPEWGIQLYNPMAANTDVFTNSADLRINLRNKGLGINVDSPGAALEMASLDSAAIIMRAAQNGDAPTLYFTSPNTGNRVGIRPHTSSNAYTLKLPSTLPSTAGQVLSSDLSGNLSWSTPSSGMPSGTSGQTLRHDGTTWVANNTLLSDGSTSAISKIGIAPTTNYNLYVYRDFADFGAGKFGIYSYRQGNSGAQPGGTSWSPVGVDAAIGGAMNWGNEYSVGVYGATVFDYDNSAAVLGSDNGGSIYGALGYRNFGQTYAGYFQGNMYLSGAFMPNNQAGTAGQVLTSQGVGTPPTWQTPSAGLTGSGTATQVAFWNGASSLSSNANLYWDNTNNRLGIGTATPNQQLEITGNFRIPSTTTTAGIVYMGASLFLHNYGGFYAGLGAGNLTTTGYQNVGIGASTLSANTSGRYNVAVGDNALIANTTAEQNTAVGFYALNTNSTGAYNTSLGAFALRTNNADHNTAIGKNSLYSTSSGGYNSALGSSSMENNTTGTFNTALGYTSLFTNSTGSQNTALGTYSLYYNGAGNNATAIGYSAMIYANNTATAFTNTNVAVGYESMRGSFTPANNTGLDNTAVGYQTLQGISSGSRNAALGSYALLSNTTGWYNTALGYEALRTNTSGTGSVAVGHSALRSNNASYNTAVGHESQYSTTSGTYNTSLGYYSLRSNNTGFQNVAIGENTLYNNTGGALNVAIGQQALYSNLSGNYSIAMGFRALQNSTASNNIAIGRQAGDAITTGSSNTFLGDNADATSGTLTNATAIGANASVSASNSLILGNNTNVGIGTSSPSQKLHLYQATGQTALKIESDGAGASDAPDIFLDASGLDVGTSTIEFQEAGLFKASLGWSTLSTQQYFFLYEGGTTSLVSKNANIGIGTVSPNTASRLHAYQGTAGYYGIYAENAYSGTSDGRGVYGRSVNADGYGFGGYFQGGYRGIYAEALGGAYTGSVAGVYGNATGTAGTRYGIFGTAAGGATNFAGYFSGNVTVTGTLSKGGGTFKIDHPQDPANKYLVHSFVESPDMMNIYNGNIVTDDNGNAIVAMPDYFDALNKDFRYQLTVMGTFAQAIVAEELSNGEFKIKTDKPNVKVSWQVTGVRKDPWANENRVVPVVEKKTDEKGKYLHPELYGQPKTKAVHYDESMERMLNNNDKK